VLLRVGVYLRLAGGGSRRPIGEATMLSLKAKC
jgi:hypothetical protein